MPPYRWALVLIASLIALSLWARPDAEPSPQPTAPSNSPQTTATTAADDPLARFGIHVTEGAAAGYVDDRVCGRCHSDLARSYREVAMSKSFYRPRASTAVEAFATPFEHIPSQRIYQMLRDGDDYTFRRHQLDAQGREINVLTIDVDWIMGSGNHARTYLYQNAQGELYQLPLAWYAADGQGQPARWGIAPGFDQIVHKGVRRIVQRECMFCHNAYPEVAEGSDERGMPHVFPTDLPEGIGCQRCHGPGAEHVRVSLAGDVPFPATAAEPSDAAEPAELTPVRASIVNPGRLPPQRRDEVCASCHLQPTVSISGIRRFERADYSYRVGEPLHEYFVHVDVDELGRPREERFEINHHPYRLRQSRCYLESDGALGCLTCHDPHRKVAAEERMEHYRAACLGCHTVDACQLESMATAPATSHAAASASTGPTQAEVDANDCVACHMPRRRPSDVIQVVMTDHAIQLPTPEAERLAPMSETIHPLVGIELLGDDRPKGSLGEVYRAIAVERAGGQIESLEHLQHHLPKADIEHVEPWHQLVSATLRSGRFEEARDLAMDLGKRFDPDSRILNMMAIAHFRLEEQDQGMKALRQALEVRPDRPEGSFNLARVLLAQGQAEEALSHLNRAIEQRRYFDRAWFIKGEALRRLGRREEAIEAYRQALAIEPASGRSYAALTDLLFEMGRIDEGERWWRHGRLHAADPTELKRRAVDSSEGGR